MKNDFVSKGRSVSDLKVHLVLTTKYRRKAFTGDMLQRLHIILEELLVKWDCKLVEFNGGSYPLLIPISSGLRIKQTDK